MSQSLHDNALDVLFRKARTQHGFLPQPVTDDVLRELYDLMKWGPTSANCCPVRIVYLRTPEAKKRLLPALAQGNVEQTMQAPVTAILAYDLIFYEKLPKLFPQNPAMRERFSKSSDVAELTAFRNGTLQGGYFILAARALGLDCGPMSGFDNDKVDTEFFGRAPAAEAPPTSRFKSNFLCNLGYGDPAKLYPRGPRLEFDEACQLL
jgi:3-hydroxypropanoate dehydrogenase